MGWIDVLFGRPLASWEDQGERISPVQGIPIFGLDALSSAAYGPEAALTILLPLGLIGVRYIVPLTAAVIVLLIIVYFSYRQTIAAYPQGGGSYTVAKENLGEGAGLLAAAALDDRLSAECGGGNLGGNRRFGFRCAAAAAAHFGDVPGSAGYIDCGQFAGIEGGGVGLRGSDLLICGHAWIGDCHWTL